MGDDLSFLLFGDQSSSSYESLVCFFRRVELDILSRSFLEQASTALQKEIDDLSSTQRRQMLDFSSIQDLNEKYHRSENRNSAIDSALLCITQLTHYIEDESKSGNENYRPQHRCLVGLCTGLFAATAITSAPSLPALVPIAVQMVLASFRIGLYVSDMADQLESPDHLSKSWSQVVPNISESRVQEILVEFQASQRYSSSTTGQLYISAASPGSVTISGPPSVLSSFHGSQGSGLASLPLPVHGPYHAPHLYANTDLEKVLQLKNSAFSRILSSVKPRFPVMSCVTGRYFENMDCKALLISVVGEMLAKPLQIQNILASCVLRTQSFRGSKCFVSAFGPTTFAQTLANTLKTQNCLNVIDCKSLPKGHLSSGQGLGKKPKLAIVGMAGRFPDAASHEKLWELLEKGLDVHREVPRDRFDVGTHVDPLGKVRNTSHTPFGCWIEDPGLFDPRFFNMSPREAFQTDPMQRMALSTAYEALEMSGYVPNRTRSTKLDRIGTFYGQTSDDWREINAAQDVDTYFITGGVRAFGPGRINYHFGFSGPSFNIDTACSSSAAAIQLAATSLWAEDCDTAVVGGLSCMTNSDIFAGLSRGQFLSKKGPCATFDNEADGYCRADACATVIIKRLDDALADKDNILGVILGTATNHSADAISITHPHGPTQQILYRNILDKAGIDPIDIDYVEMHGTGTQAGDGTEMLSVTNVFAPATLSRKRNVEQPLFLGSVKANVGHGEAASGITALVKCLLMLQKNAIPPHVGIKGEINQGFPKDLADRNINIALSKTPFCSKAGRGRRIFLNNFSAAGGNTGVLLEEGPIYAPALIDPRSEHIVTLTAKSKSALIRNIANLTEYIELHPKTSVADLAYTTTARRIHHNWRCSITGSEISQIKVDLLSKRLDENFIPISPVTPRVAFLFTGQGSHYAAMGKELYQTSSVFRASIDEFENVAQIHGFPRFVPLIDGSSKIEELSPVVVQLGLVSIEMALARLWRSWGILPSVVIGHSLGEYAALNVAGVLSVSDSLFLVGTRAQLLVEKCTAGTHAMLAVQESASNMETRLLGNTTVKIACINGPRETVIGGDVDGISSIADKLAITGIKCTRIQVPFAFHTGQVDPILDDFEKIAGTVRFSKEKIPVISSLLGCLSSTSFDAVYLRRHAREPVNFFGGLIAAQSASVIDENTIWLEVGPHPVCLSMVKATFGVATIGSATLRRNESCYRTIVRSLSTLHSAGLAIDWNEYHRDFSGSVRLLHLPSYSFDDKNYWIQYDGDWNLTKGRTETKTAKVEDIRRFSTSSIHKVTSEVVRGEVVEIFSESDMARADLRGVVSGHLVNGVMLCPSSLYADMAMTLCDYAYKLVKPNEETRVMNVSSMKVPKTLVARADGKSQILKLSARVYVEKRSADLRFFSGEGKNEVEHATCQVFFNSSEKCLAGWESNAYLIQSRVDWLLDAEKQGKAHKVGRGLAYKLFAALVDYDDKYRGMEEVILHSENMEATSKVVFQTTEKDGSFMCSPYWIDSVAHISGFIVNGSDATNSQESVYISHGWDSLQIAEAFSQDKIYRSYVRMQPRPGNIMAGDVWVFHEDRIIALVGGLKFQCIPRKVFNVLLPPPGTTAKSRQPLVKTTKLPSATSIKQVGSSKTVTAQVNPENIATVNQKLISVTTLALDILVAEIGVDIEELVDNIAFTDLGCDSLMSLTVSGRMREELEIDIHSHEFQDYPTIGEFKNFLRKFEGKPRADSFSVESASPSGNSPLIDSSSDTDGESKVTTPMDDNMSVHSKSGGAGITQLIRSTIASEMGFDAEEIFDTTDLAELGLDSLMALSVLSALREKTDLTLPADLFTVNPTIGDIETLLNTRSSPDPIRRKRLEAVLPISLIEKPLSKPARYATSVLLQGNSRRALKQLWIVPDGSGSATSYVDIPDLSPDLAVWGLNSPFMKTPEDYDVGVIGIASSFITEIKRRQPAGPYLLAGWSAGGVIAFEAVNQLTKNGDRVEQLILIDAPCPDIIEPLPSSLHRWFASIGLLGDGDLSKLPSWLLPHFAASVTALSTYVPEKINLALCPMVTAIWCEDGVCKLPNDPRPDPFPYGHAQFLLDNRIDFGPNLWDRYLDVDKIRCRHMPGNHFSMMKGELAKILGSIMEEAISQTN